MKTLKLLSALIAIFIFISCDVSIPETDDVSPKFTLNISRQNDSTNTDKESFKITEATENVTLNVVPGGQYSIIGSLNDVGGVEYGIITVPKKDSLVFELNEWEKTETETARTFELKIEEDNAKNINLIAGGFVVLLGEDEYTIDVTVKDFGGQEKKVNTTTNSFKIKSSNSHTITSCNNCDEE